MTAGGHGHTSGLSRRSLLIGGVSGAGGAVLGAAATAGHGLTGPPEPRSQTEVFGAATVECFGAHQAGIATPPQAAASFVALDLRPGLDRSALVRLMRLWTDDIARLTQGAPALADTEPDLARHPARLTVTVGFGTGVFRSAGMSRLMPGAVDGLPPFPIDALEERWSGGDLLLQAAADDRLTVAHAVHVLTKDARAFARPRWAQHGFQRHAGVTTPGETPRNLMGQVDGTANPRPGSQNFDDVVWSTEPAWLRGGTTLVLRRIRMDLVSWEQLDRVDREQVIGRRLSDGAPLTGEHEDDPVDLEATDAVGLPVIPAFAHVRRAHPATTGVQVVRRGYNYDDGWLPDGTADLGLLFASYQADVEAQFVPIQRSLAELDLLNTWTTPVGSAVFAVPPGFSPDGFVGDTLLTSS